MHLDVRVTHEAFRYKSGRMLTRCNYPYFPLLKLTPLMHRKHCILIPHLTPVYYVQSGL